MKKYDVLVVGGGIAGVTAAIYLKRAGKNVGLIERGSLGGQILTAHKVENYPLLLSATGYEVADKLQEQVEALKIDLIFDNIVSFSLEQPVKELKGNNGEYAADYVILAMGKIPKPLGLDGEEKLIGSGVSYCTTCDGAFFRGRDVVVAGIGGHAVSSVNYLAPIAQNVYVVSPSKLPKTVESANVHILDSHRIVSLAGNPLSEVSILDEKGNKTDIAAEGLFVASGSVPATDLIKGVVSLDEKGYIITDNEMKTNIEGVFAVGDIRQKKLRQLVTAASDGAIAAGGCSKKV